MGMMDYLIGKNVGQESGRATDSAAVSNARQDAHDAEIGEIQMQTQVYRLIGTVNTLTKRFTRERQERMAWRKAAEFRKLSLLKHGLTEEQIYAEQREFSADAEINAMTDKKIMDETAKIDAEFENRNDASGPSSPANPIPN